MSPFLPSPESQLASCNQTKLTTRTNIGAQRQYSQIPSGFQALHLRVREIPARVAHPAPIGRLLRKAPGSGAIREAGRGQRDSPGLGAPSPYLWGCGARLQRGLGLVRARGDLQLGAQLGHGHLKLEPRRLHLRRNELCAGSSYVGVAVVRSEYIHMSQLTCCTYSCYSCYARAHNIIYEDRIHVVM